MALYSREDFGELCGISPKHFTTYVKRKKIILTGDFVDDKDPINAALVEKRLGKLKKPAKTTPIITKSASEKNDFESENSETNPDSLEKNRENLSYTELERQKKLADLIKVEADTIHRNLQIEKLMGLSIPTELVKSLIAQLSKSIVSSFKDGADNFLIEISKRKDINNKELAELRGQLTKILNQATEKSIVDCKNNMKSIVNTYSEKKEVGEHE